MGVWSPTDIERIAALSPARVEAYLVDKGWKREGAFGPFGVLFSISFDEEKHEVALPTVTTVADFGRSMEALVWFLQRLRIEIIGYC